MNTRIKALLVDDEQHNLNVLKSLLDKYCSIIEVIDTAESADIAYDKILALQPQLIFLDIKMPDKSGFDLLKKFTHFNFEIIFVSAFNEYAITAFEFNALGYILKPIDYVKLTSAVDKAISKIQSSHQDETILHFVKSLEETKDIVDKVLFHHNGRVVFVNITDILYIEMVDDMTCIRDAHLHKYCSSKDIKLYEDLLLEFKQFVRVSRNAMINVNYIKSYSKGDTCIIEMIDKKSFEVSRRKKSEVLNKISAI
jgi:two-component system, LytTR family, response regulator